MSTKKKVVKKAVAKKKVVKKAVAKTIPSVIVYLGKARELVTYDHHWKWSIKDNYGLYSNPTGSKLYVLKQRGNRTRELKDTRFTRSAERTFDMFFDRDSDSRALLSITLRALKKGSRVANITYSSDKWDTKMTTYIHMFAMPPIAWADSDTKPTQIIIEGGRIDITRRGIEG